MSDGQDPLLAEMQEQTRWLRFLGLQQIRPLLIELLRDERERRAYDLTDGVRTTRELAASSGASNATISRWWTRWVALGLATTNDHGRARHMVKLADIGMSPSGGPATSETP